MDEVKLLPCDDELVKKIAEAMRKAPALSPTVRGVSTGEMVDFDMLARAAIAAMSATVVTGEHQSVGVTPQAGSGHSAEPEPTSVVSAETASVPNAIPRDIAEQVLSMGRVEWGMTDEFTEEGHLAHLEKSLRLTREHFNFEDVPVAMHGLYLAGTETVLCHTGTSPNSGPNAQALAGAWNWLFDQCAAQPESNT